jgi:hypothetical protein
MKYYTRKEAETLTGKSNRTIQKYCAAHGVSMFGRNYQLTAADIKAIKALPDRGQYTRTQAIKDKIREGNMGKHTKKT